MYVIENSIVFSIVLISLSLFLTFSFRIENKINNYISVKAEDEKKEYAADGIKKFKPDKIQKIITNIESVVK